MTDLNVKNTEDVIGLFEVIALKFKIAIKSKSFPQKVVKEIPNLGKSTNPMKKFKDGIFDKTFKEHSLGKEVRLKDGDLDAICSIVGYSTFSEFLKERDQLRTSLKGFSPEGEVIKICCHQFSMENVKSEFESALENEKFRIEIEPITHQNLQTNLGSSISDSNIFCLTEKFGSELLPQLKELIAKTNSRPLIIGYDFSEDYKKNFKSTVLARVSIFTRKQLFLFQYEFLLSLKKKGGDESQPKSDKSPTCEREAPKSTFDEYGRSAQILPAGVSLFPIALFITFLFWDFANPYFGLGLKSLFAASILIVASITLAIAYASSIRKDGKSIEKKLFHNKLGFPSTYFLLYTHGFDQYSENKKERIRQTMKKVFPYLILPSKEDEEIEKSTSPHTPRTVKALTEANDAVIKQIKDGRLIKTQVVLYGQARNLIGGARWGLVASILALICFLFLGAYEYVWPFAAFSVWYLINIVRQKAKLTPLAESYATNLHHEFLNEYGTN